MLKKKLQWIGT